MLDPSPSEAPTDPDELEPGAKSSAGNTGEARQGLRVEAPDNAVTIYAGQVMHQRMKPKQHRFSYRVYSILIDLDRHDEIGRKSFLLSHNRWNAFSIHDSDHGPADGTKLRPWADHLLEQAGLKQRAKRIVLLCYPRIFGLVFNPLSVYYAYDASGDLIGVIYEVRNTFGERHSYVGLVEKGELRPSGLRQSRAKLFYVSPLMDMDMRYHFNLKPPGETVTIRILETDGEGPILAATFHGRALPASTGNLLKQAIRVPFQTLKVVAAIHYEALRLWLKGIKLRDRPPAPAPFSVIDGVAEDR